MNDQFTKQLLASLGGQVGDKLAGRNVVSRDQAVSALSSLTPVILGSLKRKQNELGESGLEELLANAGISETHADDIDEVLEKGLAGHTSQTEAVLDDETQDQTARALSQKLNIGTAAAKKLIPMLAPIIIGMLIKKGGSSRSSKGGLGGIGAILDRDGDGSILDDIAGMILGGGKSSGQKRGGIMQWLLALFFRRK
jgi:hypothetical protein